FAEFYCGFRPCFRQHTVERHRRAALALAFVRGFHESEDFDRLFSTDRRFAGFEEAYDFPAKFLIAAFSVGLDDAFAAESDRAKVRSVAANSTVGSDATVLPHARNEIGVFGLN